MHSSVSSYFKKENQNLRDCDLFLAIEISFKADTPGYFQDARLILITCLQVIAKKEVIAKNTGGGGVGGVRGGGGEVRWGFVG